MTALTYPATPAHAMVGKALQRAVDHLHSLGVTNREIAMRTGYAPDPSRVPAWTAFYTQLALAKGIVKPIWLLFGEQEITFTVPAEYTERQCIMRAKQMTALRGRKCDRVDSAGYIKLSPRFGEDLLVIKIG